MAGDGEGREARSALETLCRDYWRPLYYYARRSGQSPEDAEDLTQGFIMGLLESGSIARATPERGRFRTFLLSSFGNFMANRHREQSTQKRGGGMAAFSIEAEETETAFALEMTDSATPESLYERSWALALLDSVMERLKQEYIEADRGELFSAVQPYLAGGGPRPGYAKIAAALGLSESALGVAVHRMRKRYAAMLREEIAGTVAGEEEVDDELQHLMQVVSAG